MSTFDAAMRRFLAPSPVPQQSRRVGRTSRGRDTQTPAPTSHQQSRAVALEDRTKDRVSIASWQSDELAAELVRIGTCTCMHMRGDRIEPNKDPVNVPFNEIKRNLRSVHQDLEEFCVENCHGLGDEIEAIASDATRHAGQSYRSAIVLEERLWHLQTRKSDEWRLRCTQQTVGAGSDGGRREVYIPSGARSVQQSVPQMPLDLRRRLERGDEPDEEPYTVAGACLPQMVNRDIASRTESTSADNPNGPPTVPSRRASIRSTTTSESKRTPSIRYMRPKDEVIKRTQQEEASSRLSLNEPDRIRQGSCGGSTITNMMMSGRKDHRCVLPCLRYIKIHEVRALKEWLSDVDLVVRSGAISRMEKVMHCIQLLQTGCRYEALAVIFSRSPREIKESCLEVMEGLLHLHSKTVNQTGDQEMYMPLWRVWIRFDTTQGRAGVYYGFGWMDVAKVLVTLNLYIGRWRMQGRLATDGPSFSWGRFFVSRGTEEVSTTTVCVQTSNEASDQEDGTNTIRPVATAP